MHLPTHIFTAGFVDATWASIVIALLALLISGWVGADQVRKNREPSPPLHQQFAPLEDFRKLLGRVERAAPVEGLTQLAESLRQVRDALDALRAHMDDQYAAILEAGQRRADGIHSRIGGVERDILARIDTVKDDSAGLRERLARLEAHNSRGDNGTD